MIGHAVALATDLSRDAINFAVTLAQHGDWCAIERLAHALRDELDRANEGLSQFRASAEAEGKRTWSAVQRAANAERDLARLKASTAAAASAASDRPAVEPTFWLVEGRHVGEAQWWIDTLWRSADEAIARRDKPEKEWVRRVVALALLESPDADATIVAPAGHHASTTLRSSP